MSSDDSTAYGLDDERWGADEEPGPEDEILERAWTALDEGEPERALAELRQVDPDWPERWIPEALACVELGELPAARHALDRASQIEGFQSHPDYLWAHGKLLLAEWRIEEARATLEQLSRIERSAGVLERLSLCADVEGDFDRADRLLAEASQLDPAAISPPRLSHEEFDEVVSRAIESLPADFQRPLETVEVIVEPVPSVWMVDVEDPGETPPDLFGLFVGSSQVERSEYDNAALPPRIFLFQRNLERAARDRDELVEEIRVTLFHEVGHMLGFDEEGVAAMGLE